jgi:hypothetical protein
VPAGWASWAGSSRGGDCDDRCAIPLNLFWPFHAPHPSKIPKIEDTEKNVIKKYIFQNFTKNINNL